MIAIAALLGDDSKVPIRVISTNTMIATSKLMIAIAALLGDDSKVSIQVNAIEI